MIDERAWNFEGETASMWNHMADYIRKVLKEVLGELKGKRHYNK